MRAINAPLLQATTMYQRVLRVLVVMGVGFIMGDGVLTPSMSVLSAVEGLQVPMPDFNRGTGVFGCVWGYLGVYGCVWVCMGVFGHTCVHYTHVYGCLGACATRV